MNVVSGPTRTAMRSTMLFGDRRLPQGSAPRILRGTYAREANLPVGPSEDQPEVQPEADFVIYILQRLTKYLQVPSSPVSY